MRSRLAVLFLTGLALRASAQDTRIDHLGANWPRIREICARYQPRTPATLDDRLRELRPKQGVLIADTALREIACVESLAYVREAEPWLVKPSHQPIHARPALDALAKYLAHHQADSLAAELLAALSLDLSVGGWGSIPTTELKATRNQVGTSPLGLGDVIAYRQEIADLMYAAVKAGGTSPLLLRACENFALAVSDAATAHVCSAQALSQGADVSWHLLRQSWFAALRRDTAEAVSLLELAFQSAHDSAARGEVAWSSWQLMPHAFASPRDVEKAWSGMDAQARVSWVREHVGLAYLAGNAGGHAAGHVPDAFAAGLMQGMSDPGYLGDLFKRCPVWSERNGFREQQGFNWCSTRGAIPDAPIGITAQMFRLWEPASGQPVGLFTFGLQRGDVDSDKDGGARVAKVDVNLRQWDWQTGDWTDTTESGKQLRAEPGTDGSHISGFLLAHPAPGPSSWSLAVVQGARYGRVSVDGSVPLANTSFALSDLIPGVLSQGLSWRIGEDTVVLAPANTMSVREPMELFFQVRNTVARSDLKMAVLLRQIVQGQILEKAALSLTFTTTAQVGITSVQKDIVLSHIERGDYALEVRILNEHDAVIATRTTNVFLR